MGIEGLKPYLKTHSKDAFQTVPLSNLGGYAIAIDGNGWMYKAKSFALKVYLQSVFVDVTAPIPQELIIKYIINNFYGFIGKLTSHNITPVWIFDGPAAHPAKEAAARLRRKVHKEDRKVKIEEERLAIMEMSALERTPDIINKFKNLLIGHVTVNQSEIDAVMNEANELGLPLFEAPYDAEILASALSVENKVIGVWAKDTDCIAAGARVVFDGFSKELSEDGVIVDAIIPYIVYEDLEMTLDQFRDFCIACQCDFNVRIKGLGPAKMRKLLLKYANDLDLLMESEPKHDWSLLNVEISRELLTGPNETCINIEDLAIDRKKWTLKMETNDVSFVPLPETDPIMVEIME